MYMEDLHFYEGTKEGVDRGMQREVLGEDEGGETMIGLGKLIN